MMQEMQEALAAVGGQIQTAPEKIPSGKTIIAVELDRDPSVSGQYMTAVDKNWQVSGVAVAIKSGHVIGSNPIFGRFSGGTPKVTACHYVRCTKCGNLVLMPLAVWEAKDTARARGIKTELDKGIGGFALLKQYGSCSCGGKWTDAIEHENKLGNALAQRALRSVADGGTVPPFLAPKAFTVRPIEEAVDLGTDWQWLSDNIGKNGQAALPFDKGLTGQTLVFNPGYWIGWVDDMDATDLFFLEKGKDRLGRGRRVEASGFNPAGIDGL